MNSHPLKSVLLDLWIPWKLFTFPIVEFSSFVVSWSVSSFPTLNLTQYQNFGAAPYLWSSQKIGLTNFAILVGACIGLPPPTSHPLIPPVGHRDNRVHMRRHPSRRHTRHRVHIQRRQLQARRGQRLRGYHNQQEPMGLRLQQVHHAVDHQCQLCTADYAEHVVDFLVVCMWHYLLLLW
jgi:hypothetical protein